MSESRHGSGPWETPPTVVGSGGGGPAGIGEGGFAQVPNLVDAERTGGRRGRGRGVVVGVVASAVLVAVVAGSFGVVRLVSSGKGSPRSVTAPRVTARSLPSIADTAGPSGSVGVYRAVDQPCTAVDVTALEQLLGARASHPVQNSTELGSRRSMYCAVAFGGGSPAGAVVRMEVLSGGADSRSMYEGLRRAETEQVSVREVKGVGAGAYSYSSPRVGRYLVAHDGNFYITVLVAGSVKASADDLISSLVQVCRQTMRNLRA